MPDSNDNVYKASPSVFESVGIGSFAGMAEVVVNHPLWILKTRWQRFESFTLNPKIIYRGMVANATSMAPITAVQIGLTRYLQTLFFNDASQMTNYQHLGLAFSAGACSAIVSCPTEMVMTYQCQTKKTFYSSGAKLFQENGIRALYAGFLATALRDGMFASCFLAVGPQLKNKISPYISSDAGASLLSGMVAGVGAAGASQAIDTVKTVQQSTKHPQNIAKTTRSLYAMDGAQAFFRGGLFRGARIVSAVTLISTLNEQLENVIRGSQQGRW